MSYWGSFDTGKQREIMEIISNDNPDMWIKVLPFQRKGEYGALQLLISKKPSKKCIKELSEYYNISFFKNTDVSDEYNYLMLVEPLRYTYEEEWHFNPGHDDRLEAEFKYICGNKWDFDGYFYITDSLNDLCRIAVIPFKANEGFDSGYNLPKPVAERLVKSIVKKLNNGEMDL